MFTLGPRSFAALRMAPVVEQAGFCESKLIRDYFADRARGTMIDVGAHFGSTLKPYLLRGWRVIACEPDPPKIERLRRFAGQGDFVLLPVAIGDVPREAATFYTSDESTGISSLIAFRPSHVEAPTTVPVTTLARIIDVQAIASIDFLKVDTEGYDYRVLAGLPWRRVRPEVILCEFDEQKTRGVEPDYEWLGGMLVDHGYQVWLSEWFPIVRYGVTHRWRSIRPFPCALEDADAWGNLIAVREDADVSRMQQLIDGCAVPLTCNTPG